MALPLAKPNEKIRTWGYLFWVEDMERNGRSYGDLLGFLEGMHVKCVCSPIHDRDRYTKEDVEGWLMRHSDPETHKVSEDDLKRVPEVGSNKKPHVHIYGQSAGPTTPMALAQILRGFYFMNWDEAERLISPKRFVKVPDIGRIIRYCAHMDAPEKAQYDPMTIHGFGNIDMSALLEERAGNKVAVRREINEHIRKSGTKSFNALDKWAYGTGDIDIINHVAGQHAYWCAIFNSMRQERQDKANAQRNMSQNN